MKQILLTVLLLLTVPLFVAASGQPACQGTVTPDDFVPEPKLKAGLLQMLGRFVPYLCHDYQAADEPTRGGEAWGWFRSRSDLQANEDGVRTNADLCMVTAFLCHYGPGHITLPEGVTWEQLRDMARRALVYAYSSHKALRLQACNGDKYWGSTSKDDHQWESSLWAMSVAYAAFFLWDDLSARQKDCIHRLLTAECNYELQRDIPTGFRGDTKAEENGWEADVLAATLGLFPDDELAPQWFERLRLFAINSYSHASDASNRTIVDPDRDSVTVAQLYRGTNLYDDFTLQNHNYFHTSYQNVVIQELGEAALALRLFQRGLHGRERWQTRALTHHCLDVQHEVLDWLALPDGELAMPNGNDWSLFLYDQLTSFTTNATFLRDPDALMMENRAYKMIAARQQTTPDGSWLLRADIGPRRMGVEAHRVMMTWLMHDQHSTADLRPSDFEDFRRRHAAAKVFTSQNIVRAFTPSRFTIFSWAPGIKSYTGYFAANTVDNTNLVVPFKAHNTGNLLGWYTVEGRRTNAVPVLSGSYELDSTAWTMNGVLLCNDSTLRLSFALFSSPGNAVVYLDQVRAERDAVITREDGALLALSFDPFTRERRLFQAEGLKREVDGKQLNRNGEVPFACTSPWMNIDNVLGILSPNADKTMTLDTLRDNNSILTAPLYVCHSARHRAVKAGEEADRRVVVYYNKVDAGTTRRLSSELIDLRSYLPRGWNGVVVTDPDGTRYLVVANFDGPDEAQLPERFFPGNKQSRAKKASRKMRRIELKRNKTLVVTMPCGR